jgi:transposase
MVLILLRDRDRLVSRLEPTFEPERQVRRIDVIAGAGGRRRWTVDDKARIVAERLEAGAAVSVVARRHGLTPQQLFGWRREGRKRSEASDDEGPSVVSAVMGLPWAPERRRQQAAPMATIEFDMGGVRVRIGSAPRSRSYRR